MTSQEIGFVTSVFSIGGLLGSSASSALSGRFGRKNASYLFGVIFLLGGLLEAFSNSKMSLAVGRLVSGLSAGAAIVNVPLLLNEIADHDTKGFLGSLNQFSVNIGILATQSFALFWANSEQWRNLLLGGFVIGIFIVAGLFFTVESPKWQVKRGSISAAKQTLAKLRPDGSDIDWEVDQWLDEIKGRSSINSEGVSLLEEGDAVLAVANNHQSVSLLKYLADPQYFNSRLIVTIVMTGQQFLGVNSIVFYGVSVIAKLVGEEHSMALNCVISLLNVIVTFFSATLVDRLGRRPLLLGSMAGMGVSAFLISLGIVKSYAYLTIGATFLYICAFGVGVGPIPFLIISEVTQLQATGVAQSFGTVLNWLATFLVAYLFPILNDWIGGYVFCLFGILSVVYGSLVWMYFPETRGKKTYAQVWDERID